MCHNHDPGNLFLFDVKILKPIDQYDIVYHTVYPALDPPLLICCVRKRGNNERLCDI